MNSGSYRAPDADRDQVAEVLHTAYAEGRITLDEHDERTPGAAAGQDVRRPDRADPRLPRGVTIVDEVTNVMGETTIKGVGEPDPTMPTIVLRGTNIMSDITVRGPKDTSKRSWWRRVRSRDPRLP